MKLEILKTFKGRDGLVVKDYEQGSTCEMGEELAKTALKQGWAIKVETKKAEAIKEDTDEGEKDETPEEVEPVEEEAPKEKKGAKKKAGKTSKGK